MMKKIYLSLLVFILTISITKGQEWQEVDCGTNEWLRDITFINANVGIVVGYNGLIIRTDDGGETWNKIPSSTTDNLFHVQFVDEKTGYITGKGATILKSIDGGETWEDISLLGSGVFSPYFINKNIGVITHNSGTYKTVDGGLTWDLLLGDDVGGNDVYLFNDDMGIISANFTISKFDANNVIDTLFSSSTKQFHNINFITQDIGFTTITVPFGDGGILRTTDQGTTWENMINTVDFGVYGFDFIDENIGYFVGGFPDYSIIITTEDGGKTFIVEDLDLGKPLFEIANNGERVFTVGRYGLMLTKDLVTNTVKTVQDNNKNISIYPNPIYENINISMSENILGDKKIEIYNLQGKLIKEEHFDDHISNHFTIDFTKVIQGSYSIFIYNDDELIASEIIVKK